MLNNKLRALVISALIVATTAGCAVMRGQQTAGAYMDDAGITTSIKGTMAKDDRVSAGAINVETMNGTVQLSGFAKSQAEKERAGQIARQTKGVKGVKNDIVVRP